MSPAMNDNDVVLLEAPRMDPQSWPAEPQDYTQK
jgi:hypothetical protein